MNLRRIVLYICCLLLPVWATAQHTLTLDSCRAMALRNQAKMQNARLEVASARETKKAAFTKYFPSISVAAGYFRSQNHLIDIDNSSINSDNLHAEVSYDGVSASSRLEEAQAELDRWGIDFNLEEVLQDFFDHFSVDASLQMLDHGLFANAVATQPIYAGGRILHGNKLAQLGVDVSELQLLMTQNEVLLNVEQSYWMVVSLHEKLATVEQFSQLLDTLRRDAEAATAAGILSQSDLLKVKLKQNELTAARIQLTNGISLATRALCQYVGLPLDEAAGCILADTLPGTLELSVAAVDPAAGVSRRTEAQLLQKAVEAAQLQRAMTLGEAMPQVAVGATYGANNLFGDYRYNGLVFATVNIPITAWWETSHNARKQDLSRQMAENNRRDLMQQMELQMRQAWNELVESYQLRTVREQAVSDAQHSLEESRNYYEAGMTSTSDYLEAQSLLQQARNELTDQRITCKLKELKYRQLCQ